MNFLNFPTFIPFLCWFFSYFFFFFPFPLGLAIFHPIGLSFFQFLSLFLSLHGNCPTLHFYSSFMFTSFFPNFLSWPLSFPSYFITFTADCYFSLLFPFLICSFTDTSSFSTKFFFLLTKSPNKYSVINLKRFKSQRISFFYKDDVPLLHWGNREDEGERWLRQVTPLALSDHSIKSKLFWVTSITWILKPDFFPVFRSFLSPNFTSSHHIFKTHLETHRTGKPSATSCDRTVFPSLPIF